MPSSTATIFSNTLSFTNYGPLTTTFTPAPSCTESDRYLIGLETSGTVSPDWRVQCSSTGYSGCTPPTSTATISQNPGVVAGYHSPGVYCPSGWATVGVASAEKDGSIGYSGSAIPTTSLSPKLLDPFDYDYKGYLLAKALEPEETMVVCCPSSMTVDGKGGCQSLVPDYTPTSACAPHVLWHFSTSTSTEFTTIDGEISSHITKSNIISTSTTSSTTTFDSADQTSYSAIEYVPMVTLVHRQSDIDAAATSTSNAAVRMMPPSTFAGGLGVGAAAMISAAVLTLGAAIVL